MEEITFLSGRSLAIARTALELNVAQPIIRGRWGTRDPDGWADYSEILDLLTVVGRLGDHRRRVRLSEGQRQLLRSWVKWAAEDVVLRSREADEWSDTFQDLHWLAGRLV